LFQAGAGLETAYYTILGTLFGAVAFGIFGHPISDALNPDVSLAHKLSPVLNT
jgi:hypothetical protein